MRTILSKTATEHQVQIERKCCGGQEGESGKLNDPLHTITTNDDIQWLNIENTKKRITYGGGGAWVDVVIGL